MKKSDAERALKRAWYLKNRDRVKEYNRRYSASHREEHAAYMRKWARKNPDKVKKWHHAWYVKKRKDRVWCKRLWAKALAWQKAHPERMRAIWRAYEKKRPPRDPDRAKASRAAGVERMTDSYIKLLIIQGTSLKRGDVPRELVEAKRALLKLHRLITRRKTT